MENVSKTLNERWKGDTARVHYLREYYYEDQWSWDFLKAQGIVQIDNTPPEGQAKDRRTDTRNGMHDDIYYEAQIAVQNTALIRAEQRMKAGLFTLHGVDQAPVSKTVALGHKLAEYRAGITARAFKASMQKLRSASQQ
jgi:creatinine amidohydrolase